MKTRTVLRVLFETNRIFKFVEGLRFIEITLIGNCSTVVYNFSKVYIF